MTDDARPARPAASSPSPARLVAEHIVVERSGKRIVRDVSLVCEAGTITGLLGPSGAGKSTFFQVLVGEERVHGGRVFLDGDELTRAPLYRRARRGLGYMPQGPSVLWELSVRENVETFLTVARPSEPASGVADRARELIQSVDLTAQLDTRAGQLSGGERRRLELARVLAGSPRVIVCDEPFAGVDPAQAARLGDLLVGLAESGVAILLADHHVEEALRVCTRAALLLDGALITSGSPAEFREHAAVRGRYLGTLAVDSAP